MYFHFLSRHGTFVLTHCQTWHTMRTSPKDLLIVLAPKRKVIKISLYPKVFEDSFNTHLNCFRCCHFSWSGLRGCSHLSSVLGRSASPDRWDLPYLVDSQTHKFHSSSLTFVNSIKIFRNPLFSSHFTPNRCYIQISFVLLDASRYPRNISSHLQIKERERNEWMNVTSNEMFPNKHCS